MSEHAHGNDGRFDGREDYLSDPAYWLWLAGVAASYVVAAKVGLELSVAYSNVTPIWAPTGISLAAMLLLGFRIWPAVAVGAFVANVTTPIPAWTAGAIAVGNTLEAVTGTYLLRRIAGFDVALARVRDVLNLVLYGAVVSTAVSATIGATSLLMAGEIESARYGFAWQLWWHGDAVGNILAAPLILSWAAALRRREFDLRRLPEELALAAGLALTGWIVFFGGRWRYPYVLFPFLVWGAFRFRQRGAATASFVVAALAVWGILSGSVPFGGVDLTTSVQILQTLTSILAVTSLTLAAGITERERSEKETVHSLSLLRATLDSTTDGILVVDLEGRIVSYNQRFVELWNIPSEIVASRDDAAAVRYVTDQLTNPDDFVARIQDVYSDPEAESYDLIEFQDGRVFERYSQAQRVDGVPVGRVWSFRDVTQQRRLDEARRRFINDAAHELRTPVAVMRGLADVLAERRGALGDKEFDATVDALSRQGERLRLLVARMLDVGRLESRSTRTHIRPLLLEPVVAAALEALPAPDGKVVTLAISPETKVLADDVALEQVVANLVMNAYRYGGGQIEVAAQADGDAVELWVSDDGPGVAPEFEPHLFEPFARPSTSSGDDGVGLGLSIVRSLVEAMGGEVRYESRRPKGATFVVRLPHP